MPLGGEDGGVPAGAVGRLERGGGVPGTHPLGEDPEVVAMEMDGVGDSVGGRGRG